MEERTRNAATAANPFAPSDVLQARLRAWVHEALAMALDEELDDVLGTARYARTPMTERIGYRHGSRPRTVTTSVGPIAITIPRARLRRGRDTPLLEWQPTILTRYARRSAAVDGTILGAYVAGVNTRRVRAAFEPLLGGAMLSRSAVSRLTRRLRESFDAWRTQSLADEPVVYVLLDAIAVKVRVNRRVQSVPVLVALGVRETGDKILLSVQLMGHESKAAWAAFLEDLVSRGLPAPVLVIIDGHAGLRAAVRATWPRAAVQRCVVHKLRNLQAYAPKRHSDDVRADFHAITTADNLRVARAAYRRFVKKWQGRAEGVARSLEEAGDELLTFFAFPKTQWKSLRTTNAIERLHEEFRRRVKTQASQPHEQSVLRLFYALWASGHIKMRRIDGWQELPSVLMRRAA